MNTKTCNTENIVTESTLPFSTETHKCQQGCCDITYHTVQYKGFIIDFGGDFGDLRVVISSKDKNAQLELVDTHIKENSVGLLFASLLKGDNSRERLLNLLQTITTMITKQKGK